MRARLGLLPSDITAVNGIAICVADYGEARAHVAAGHFDDGLALDQRSGFVGVSDDLERGAVFHAAARLEELRLRVDLAGPGVDAAEFYKWRVADEVQTALPDHVESPD